ncbi:hypothetical protein [Actinomadura sp. 6N118]|uniref:hypothetical protein n=1 Tax=Actinomadura sp. 6N118 TaxID=3375151 RepID=UPI003799E3AF
MGYFHLQSTRPQTLAYSLNDSPAGQLAWIVEKFHDWTDQPVDRDHLLTSISVTWFTGTGATSAHATYDGIKAWRQMLAADTAQSHTGPPTGVGVFAADTTIRALMDPVEEMHWSNFDRGGHFPAMETPDLLTADLRAFFRPLR